MGRIVGKKFYSKSLEEATFFWCLREPESGYRSAQSSAKAEAVPVFPVFQGQLLASTSRKSGPLSLTWCYLILTGELCTGDWVRFLHKERAQLSNATENSQKSEN